MVTDAEHARPLTRADCLPGGMNECRPCPYMACRHHLGLTMSQVNTHLRGGDVMDTCSLDVADHGGVTHLECAELMGVSTMTVRRLEASGKRKMLKVLKELINE